MRLPYLKSKANSVLFVKSLDFDVICVNNAPFFLETKNITFDIDLKTIGQLILLLGNRQGLHVVTT